MSTAGFARTLAFGAVGALALPVAVLVMAPALPAAWAAASFSAAAAVLYAAGLARGHRAQVAAAAAAFAVVAASGWLAEHPRELLAGAALAVALVRGALHRPAPLGRALGVELVLGASGLAAAAALAGASLLGWALAFWAWFLVQSLFFLVAGPRRSVGRTDPPEDAFERACRQLESLLET
jgi:hypothetical protein